MNLQCLSGFLRRILLIFYAWVHKIARRDRLHMMMYQMSERDLKDIGLQRSDFNRVALGFDPPTARPPRLDA